MERAEDIVAKALYAVVAGAAVIPTAGAAFEMWQNTVPVVEAQSPIYKETVPIDLTLVDTCANPVRSVTMSGTIDLTGVTNTNQESTVTRFWLNGNYQGILPYAYSGSGLFIFDPETGRNMAVTPSRVIVGGKESNTIGNFAFVRTSDGHITANIANVHCVG